MPRKFLIGQQNWRDCTKNDFFDIPQHEDYEINIFGDVYRKEKHTTWTRNRKHLIPKQKMCVYQTKNYTMTTLDSKHYCLHKILAEVFLENPNNYSVVDHLDGNKKNNCLDNLEWCSHSENTKRAYDLGLNKRAKPVICVETGEIFKSATEAGKALGHKNGQSKISACSLGKRNRAYGYHWKFVERSAELERLHGK